VITDIQDYSRAWALREITEKFIATKIAVDLDKFENLNPDEDFLEIKALHQHVQPCRFQNEGMMS